MTSENLMKLQGLFRELFQLDMADLDFGLYRLFNIKRHEIENFLTKQLPKEVDEKFQILTEQDKADYREYLEKLEGKINDDFPPDTILPDGDVKPAYRDAPLVKRYLDQKERIERIDVSEEQKADVFNHLFNFFSRYYDEGDFIPKRFYGSRESYAVPYNGEEVFFHWANKDQHYVKSGENFRDYSFKVEGLGTEYRIRFILSDATTPQDNTKGEYRYFFPQPKKTSFDKKTKTLILPFEYRLPTAEEVQKYGTKTKGQDAILIEAVPKVMGAVPDDMLRDLLGEVVHKTDREEVTLLLKRLRHFTRKNTTDFFIHKNLEGFLNQELEFYIKDQMLHLTDLEADFDQKRLMLRVFRRLADTIITFLSQIEEVQKRLFEKKKFVLETNYCITLDRVPEELYPEIAANDAQREEWVKLFAIDEIEGNLIVPAYSEPLTVEFLKANPCLVVDTKHFGQEFNVQFLASLDECDVKTDGNIICSENYQALGSLQALYGNRVRSVYIDPPFNTAASEILYKNNYKHSSWVSMIMERIRSAANLMGDDAVICLAIDDFELPALTQCMSNIFGEKNRLATVVVRSNPHGRAMAAGFSPNHEYAMFYGKTDQSVVGRLPRDQKRQARYPECDEHGTYAWMNFRATGANSRRVDRPKLFYPIFVSKDGEIRVSSMSWSEKNQKWEPVEQHRVGESVVHPLDSEKSERVWNLGWERAQKEASSVLAAKRVAGEWQIYRKYRPNQKGALPGTWWDDAKYSATESGTRVIKNLIGERESFSYPKSLYLVEDCLRASNCTQNSCALDFFAGSGTTAHAVINLNREDGGNRKYILVEMADYFDTVLVPRIKKVVYSKDWKNGKPVSREGISHMFKYIRLESYEDVLHNLASDGAMARIKSKEEAYKKAKGENEYCIHYLVKLPMEAGDTMLNLTKLEHPFDYTLEIFTDDGPREQAVDLVETFNLLYGLSVRRLETWTDKKDGRSYRIVKATNWDGLKRILVVWRDMSDLDPKIERKFLEGMLEEEDEFDEKFINGDTATPGFQSLDSLFKRLMEAD